MPSHGKNPTFLKILKNNKEENFFPESLILSICPCLLVFVTIVVAVQYEVLKDKVYEAFYKLSNPHNQINREICLLCICFAQFGLAPIPKDINYLHK